MKDNPCDRCGHEVDMEFTVGDAVWAVVTGHLPDSDGTHADGYWCLPCFLAESAKVLGDTDIRLTVHVRSASRT